MLLATGVYWLNLRTTGISLLNASEVAAVMLYFRLLGRLAWVCDERFRQMQAEEEDEAEEETSEEDESPEIRPTPIDDF